MTLRVLIVDDEPAARRRLRRLVEELPEACVVGEVGGGTEALALVGELDPDVLLLDVNMPGLDGLELARALGERTHVVFTTAHREHAVAAFETAAVDYLLKPIRRERLERALERVRRLVGRSDRAALEGLLRRALDREGLRPDRISARRGDVIELFDPLSIPRFRSDAGYVVFTKDGREHVVDESLSELEERLAPLGFQRVHRSELVRLDDVRALHRQDQGTVAELSDGQRARVSRAQLAELKRRLGIP